MNPALRNFASLFIPKRLSKSQASMKQQKGFILFSGLLFVLIYIIENINQRFWLNDFQVYYGAAKALSANAQVYGLPFGLGTGFYKYSPEFLLFILPLTNLSFQAASTLHFIGIALASILALRVIHRLLLQSGFLAQDAKTNLFLILSFICVLNHLVRELHLGNVNMILVMLISGALLALHQNKSFTAGLCLALAILIKPYLVILLLPLLYHRRIQVLVAFGMSTLVMLMVFTLYAGFGPSLHLHQAWLKAMLEHNSYLSSAHTVSSLLHYYFHLPVPASFQWLLLGFVMVLYTLLYFIRIQKRAFVETSKKYETGALNASVWILLAAFPNILVTDTEHFLYSLPMIMLLMSLLRTRKSSLLWILFIVFVLLYGANSSDLLGSSLSEKVEQAGVLGLANLGLMALSLFLLAQHNSKYKITA